MLEEPKTLIAKRERSLMYLKQKFSEALLQGNQIALE